MNSTQLVLGFASAVIAGIIIERYVKSPSPSVDKQVHSNNKSLNLKLKQPKPIPNKNANKVGKPLSQSQPHKYRDLKPFLINKGSGVDKIKRSFNHRPTAFFKKPKFF